ncbi:hypothetical protein LY622_00610 [Halomonas sp. M5N1S17]|uniref:hypothetical protein n=1 Tax=Halomonas alkalisoli TaxID=2907158 RepID=UPI001F3FF58D|nr:hypothetical protein [Halomonas alkalisoli]MCE9661931.1 hypothetical protein [Halomonas alkalisoli]
MSMPEAGPIAVMRRSLQMLHQEHVGNLLRIPQPYLDELRPDRPVPLLDVLESYNRDVAVELARFGDQLKAEVVRVLERASANGVSDLKEQVLSLVSDVLCPDLYRKRFAIFISCIERHLARYGLPLDKSRYRIDIPESLASAHAENACRRLKAQVGNEIDLLALGVGAQGAPQQDQARRTTYERLNDLYERHQMAFWFVGLVGSAALGLLFL